MSQWVKISFVFCMAGVLFSACTKDPGYPITPNVTDVRIVPSSASLADIVFSFTDGDGDIGWPTAEEAGEQKDIVLRYEILENGIWMEQEDVQLVFVIIPSLTPVGQDKFLEGEISVEIAYPPSPPIPNEGDSIRFGVTLKDRAGRVSEQVFSNLSVI